MTDKKPPYKFRLDPGNDDIVRASFRIETSENEEHGDLHSLRLFDREQQKDYYVSYLMKDSFDPPRVLNGTLKVVIGDVNDHKMKPGSKNILVYSDQHTVPQSEIGQVYVDDMDDWDLDDKTFHWKSPETPYFELNEDTGMLTMRRGTPYGSYFLKFTVDDKRHSQTDVPANVSITIKKVDKKAIDNSGFLRTVDTSAEDFIKTWEWKTKSVVKSKAEKLKEKLAELLEIDVENIDIFLVDSRGLDIDYLDVRFSASDSDGFIAADRMEGLITKNLKEFEKYVGIKMRMVGNNYCNRVCGGPCRKIYSLDWTPKLIDTNRTALVFGRRIRTKDAECL